MRRPKMGTNHPNHDVTANERAYLRVVESFASDRAVSCETRKGFGSGALKANGRIFAMLSSRGKFVVKLPESRVDELAASGNGERFDPGHGRIMREWIVVAGSPRSWLALAREALDFVNASPGKRPRTRSRRR